MSWPSWTWPSRVRAEARALAAVGVRAGDGEHAAGGDRGQRRATILGGGAGADGERGLRPAVLGTAQQGARRRVRARAGARRSGRRPAPRSPASARRTSGRCAPGRGRSAEPCRCRAAARRRPARARGGRRAGRCARVMRGRRRALGHAPGCDAEDGRHRPLRAPRTGAGSRRRTRCRPTTTEPARRPLRGQGRTGPAPERRPCRRYQRRWAASLAPSSLRFDETPAFTYRRTRTCTRRSALEHARHQLQAPAFDSGSLRLPHFGDCTHDGQPLSHGHSRDQPVARRRRARSNAQEALARDPDAAGVAVVDEDRRAARSAGARSSTGRRCPSGRTSPAAAARRSASARPRAARRAAARAGSRRQRSRRQLVPERLRRERRLRAGRAPAGR